MEEISLTKLKSKQSAMVKTIEGGQSVRHRLETLGIRKGKKITMISSHFWRGPVTVLAGKTKIAIGHGMAQKIKVSVEE
ncbi:MAG: ferrous iron transport protein A [Candidatus Omnitrophica bacterium]|nr:ferrous iron transport protein A [Candidatus Omnitrophota bacterium]